MADKTVSMTLAVDVKQVDAATAAQKRLADQTQKTADAQKKLNEQSKAAQQLFDKTYRSQNQAIAMSAPAYAGQAGVSRTGGVGPASGAGGAVPGYGAGAGPGGGGAGGSGFGLGTIAKFALGGLAIGAANRGVGSAFENARREYGRPAGEDVFAGLSGIPILGKFADQFEDLAGGATGLSNKASRNRQALAAESAGRRSEFDQQQFAIRRQGDQQISDLAAQKRAADAQVTATKQYSRLLNNTPNLGQYFQDAQFGVRTDQTGALALQEARANEDAGGARQRYSDAELALKSQQAIEEKARQESRLLTGEAANAEAAREAALRKQSNKRSIGFGSPYQTTQDNQTIDQNVEQATERALQAQNRLGVANSRVAKEREETERRINEVNQARVGLVEKDRVAAEASLAREKDKLAILGQQRDAARSGAVQSSLEDEGTKNARVEALQRLNRDGIGALTDEEKSLLQGHAQTRSYFENRAREAGRYDSSEQALRQGTGENRTYDQLDNAFKQSSIEIEKRGAAIATQAAKELADSLEIVTKQLAESLKKAIADAILSLNSQITQQRTQANIINPP